MRAQFYTSNLFGGSEQNLAAGFKTMVALTAATATLTDAEIYQAVAGASGAPNATDCSIQLHFIKQTAAGTSTPATPIAYDGSKRAAGIVGAVNFTAEGTTTASTQYQWSTNQRQSWQNYFWQGDEFVIPATNLAGWAFRCASATYASTMDVVVSHRE